MLGWLALCPAELAQQQRSDLIRSIQTNEDGVDAVQNGGPSSSNTGGVSSEVDELAVSQSANAEGKESRKPNIARRPYTPSKAEVDEHLPLHLEYRSWCPHCVAGNRISAQHRRNLHGHSE